LNGLRSAQETGRLIRQLIIPLVHAFSTKELLREDGRSAIFQSVVSPFSGGLQRWIALSSRRRQMGLPKARILGPEGVRGSLCQRVEDNAFHLEDCGAIRPLAQEQTCDPSTVAQTSGLITFSDAIYKLLQSCDLRHFSRASHHGTSDSLTITPCRSWVPKLGNYSVITTKRVIRGCCDEIRIEWYEFDGLGKALAFT